MLEEIDRGIAVLHHNQPVIVHRDLKTLNVLVTKEWHCKVADFGLARFKIEEDSETLNKCRGTLIYIAPEVFRGEGYLVKSDVYSYSLIMWEIITRLLVGKYDKPFGEYKHLRMDVQILVQAAKKDKRPTPKPSTPQELKDLIVDAWQPSKDDRPDIDVVLRRVGECKQVYQEHKGEWDEKVGRG